MPNGLVQLKKKKKVEWAPRSIAYLSITVQHFSQHLNKLASALYQPACINSISLRRLTPFSQTNKAVTRTYSNIFMSGRTFSNKALTFKLLLLFNSHFKCWKHGWSGTMPRLMVISVNLDISVGQTFSFRNKPAFTIPLSWSFSEEEGKLWQVGEGRTWHDSAWERKSPSIKFNTCPVR